MKCHMKGQWECSLCQIKLNKKSGNQKEKYKAKSDWSAISSSV